MSYCALVLFRAGKPDENVEFRNAWGGVAYVWQKLFDRYVRSSEHDYLFTDPTLRWIPGLLQGHHVSAVEKAVLLATCDYALVIAKDFGRFAHDLRAFVTMHSPASGSVCHLLAWADVFDGASAEAIGFYATSVGDNLWYDWDEAHEVATSYDLATESRHFDIYAALAAYDKAKAESAR